MLEGLVLHDKGYPSTSLSQEVASEGYGVHGVVAEIRVPAGSRAVYLEMPGFHDHDYREYELLLPRDSDFRIISAEKKEGTVHLVLEALLP